MFGLGTPSKMALADSLPLRPGTDPELGVTGEEDNVMHVPEGTLGPSRQDDKQGNAQENEKSRVTELKLAGWVMLFRVSLSYRLLFPSHANSSGKKKQSKSLRVMYGIFLHEIIVIHPCDGALALRSLARLS